jgi:hypothetical protein
MGADAATVLQIGHLITLVARTVEVVCVRARVFVCNVCIASLNPGVIFCFATFAADLILRSANVDFSWPRHMICRLLPCQSSPRRIAPQLAAAGNHLEFFAREAWVPLSLCLESQSRLEIGGSTEERFMDRTFQQLKIMGVVALARDMRLFSHVCKRKCTRECKLFGDVFKAGESACGVC